MPGKPGKQQGLFDDGSLIGFLQSTLEAMEAAAGGQLSEERAKLQELQMALGRLGLTATQPLETDDLGLASQLEKLEQQLEAIEAQLLTADDPTRQLLTKSTAVWAGVQQDGKSPEDHAVNSNSSDGASAPAADGGKEDAPERVMGENGCASRVDQTVASGLPPVAEQDDGVTNNS